MAAGGLGGPAFAPQRWDGVVHCRSETFDGAAVVVAFARAGVVVAPNWAFEVPSVTWDWLAFDAVAADSRSVVSCSPCPSWTLRCHRNWGQPAARVPAGCFAVQPTATLALVVASDCQCSFVTPPIAPNSKTSAVLPATSQLWDSFGDVVRFAGGHVATFQAIIVDMSCDTGDYCRVALALRPEPVVWRLERTTAAVAPLAVVGHCLMHLVRERRSYKQNSNRKFRTLPLPG